MDWTCSRMRPRLAFGDVTVRVPLDAVTVVITEEVRELVRRTEDDPAREPEQVWRLVEDVVAEYDERVSDERTTTAA